MSVHDVDGPETLASLVAEQAGTGRKFTFAALSERSIDPESGYRPSANLLWKISQGESVKVNPQLIRAIAVGLDLGLERVATAATHQFIGFVVGSPLPSSGAGGEVVVVHQPDATPGDLTRASEFVDDVLKDQQPDS